ncbi:hypothetical protein TTHERM_00532510 (macronuclear) [Tetrahymena thermophila SB210]|uniref:Uncharacterized protein n=1 Tax=Tetrahymena thermophila (strain SB210) TaxID=312017 RepID=Q248B8_TETTS|nr:hypothetical protein TTHERM_00532510 [Tetrahymena thermophila SB210]EAS04127.1 hypothetical protein TTHERM_00532510 [Tetrahymena thermophila SB210]|eukprot:XP_001024372.1 hypothetical protein TTHERM_00532510 [Tetrahymena thermophila SB210]
MEENKLNLQINRKDQLSQHTKVSLISKIGSLPQFKVDFSKSQQIEERGKYKKEMLMKSKINFMQSQIKKEGRGNESQFSNYRNLYEKSFSAPTPYYNIADDSSSIKLYNQFNQYDFTSSSLASQTVSDTFSSQIQNEQTSDQSDYIN